jgi:ATP-dependent Lhr-like helicase
MPSDLLEQAVLAREMAAGRVEAIRVPINCLDILAQQLVAMAAMDPWSVPDLFALVRRAYPYRDLSPQAFETTLEMISGRFRLAAPKEPRPLGSGSDATPLPNGRGSESAPPASRPGTLEALQPRVSWDRVHNRLHSLPGSQHMALVNGGSIPDTGQYAAYTGNGVRIGELDEEFIYERRIGDAFLLGTNAWRIERIEADRVIVSAGEGALATVPFWKGETIGRTYDLGRAIGEFLRELPQRLTQSDCQAWLEREYFLDAASARNLVYHAQRQLVATGCLPSDRTLCIEASRDQLGDWQVLLLSPLGSRLHLSLRLALEGRLRQWLGYHPQCMHHADGILVRLTDTDEPILDLFDGLTPENVEGFILEELAESALFALRFRQNAARALLLPRGKPGRRAPLWLQRLRGRDLLQVARRHPDFPIVVETFRECLHDHLEVERLKELLADIRDGRVEVKTRRAEQPSPFASAMLFSFTAAYMYEYDSVESESGHSTQLDRQLLEQLVSPHKQGHLLDPRAVHQVEKRLRGVGMPPRTVAEMAEWLRRLGDLTNAQLEGPMLGFLEQLEAEGRALRLELPRCRQPMRWVATEEESLYRQAFGLADATADQAQEAGAAILARFLTTHALVGLAEVLDRYPFDAAWTERQLKEWERAGRVVPVQRAEVETMQWSAPENLESVQRGSLALLRREVVTCAPPQFADFVLRWQGVHPEHRRGQSTGLTEALERLQGLPLPAEVWEQFVLPARVLGYQPRWLDEWVGGGEGAWVGHGGGDSGTDLIAFLGRETFSQLPQPFLRDAPALDPDAEQVLECLRTRGASFLTDLAADTGLSPGVVRSSLWALTRRSLVTNDHFDVIRRGEETPVEANGPTAAGSRLPTLRQMRRRFVSRPEGRWSLLRWGHPEPEPMAVFQASLLLNRYGIVARELALLDPWMTAWRILYEVLSSMELTGDVRRGYFVEGLSGAQFATPQAAEMLQQLHLPSTATAPVVLLHSMDPANLYGSGAPFDIALLDGGTRSFQRRSGNWLAVRAGRPVLLVEQQGKRLTALASSSRDDILAGVACLPGMFDNNRALKAKYKLTVEEWNGQPVTTTTGKDLLEAAGFVRDYHGMTLYAAWR